MQSNGSAPNQHQFLTAKEAAAIARYSYVRFMQLLRKPRHSGIPVKKIGRTIRIPHQKFLKWLGD